MAEPKWPVPSPSARATSCPNGVPVSGTLPRRRARSLPTWPGLLGNLMAVTLGNIVGGTILVGAVYWLIYLRAKG
jgi:hypothetical protein